MKTVANQDSKAENANFFSTDKGKYVLLAGMLLIMVIVYFVFYTGSDSGETTSPPVNNQVQTNPPVTTTPNLDNSVEGAGVSTEQTVNVETAAITGVKNVFRPLVNEKSSAEQQQNVTKPVDWQPVIPQLVEPAVEKKQNNANTTSNEKVDKPIQVIETPEKPSIEQLVSAKVTGIVGSGDSAMVIMEVDGNSQVYRKGDVVKEDIKIGEIAAKSIILVRDNDRLEIQLGGK